MKFNIDSTTDMEAFSVLEMGSVVDILIGEKEVRGVVAECGTTSCLKCSFDFRNTMVHKGYHSLCAYINTEVLTNKIHMRAFVELEDVVE